MTPGHIMFHSINPYNQEIISAWSEYDEPTVAEILRKSLRATQQWRTVPLRTRTTLMLGLAKQLRERSSELAGIITREMGKPILESVSEIEKCAWVTEYYAENADGMLQSEHVEGVADRAYVRKDPLGTILAIMPWNFPFWQVFRCAIPMIAAGNSVVLKHAPNVFGCAEAIEGVFREAGFPDGVFAGVRVHHRNVANIISHQAINAVTFTGSTTAGAVVAAAAGASLKKSVLELGGSNAMVAFDDANVQSFCDDAVVARFSNAGQSCIAAKRLIIHKKHEADIIGGLQERVASLIPGDPMQKQTTLGPLARTDLAEKLEQQVVESIRQGARCVVGGNRERALFEATILDNVKPSMRVFDEETFGPVAAITVAESNEQALQLAQKTPYGLGVALYTADIERAENVAVGIKDGSVFINGIVRSDPRMPFGGTGNSGYGRELSHFGLTEFVNLKSVIIKNQLG
ncbi:MAG: aldehyde dehydrogenase family protein [Candidatus Kapaibacterium sp.]|nr:MAG: aldehyde dehydrogenase family protein [Candidatus Kapabacteria bacterium]